jgi:hypothetical protein
MKKIMEKLQLLMILFSFLSINNNAFSQFENSNLDDKKIVNLHKNKPNSPKILAGIANIRFKSNQKIDNEILKLLAIPNNDFKIIDKYLSQNQAISSQKERFEKYSKAQQNKILELEEKLFRTFIVEFDANIDVTYFCRIIQQKYPNIEFAEPYFVPEAQEIPDDPLVDRQNVLQKIQAFEAWDICEGSEEILIGISDSGLDFYHEDIFDAIEINENETENNGIDDDENGYIDDYLGYNFAWKVDGAGTQGDVNNPSEKHGTDVAGIIAARVNNGIGIAGVANKCKIVPIKIVAKSGGYLYGYQSMIYAANRGCKVLNCSWGSANYFSHTEQLIVDYAFACDVAIVASGGNLGSGVTDPYCTFFPAGYYGVLGVSQSNNQDAVISSVVGTSTRLIAQGVGNYSIRGTNSYPQIGNGTSFASPVVAGIVGILRSYRPELSAIEAIEIVRTASDNIRNANNNDKFIPGRANMLKTLQLDYEDMPAIILKEYYFEDKNGEKQERFFVGDTAIVVLKLTNILANAYDISMNLENIFSPDTNAYELIDSEVSIAQIEKNENYLLKLRILFKKPTNLFNTFYLVAINATTFSGKIYNDDFKLHLYSLNEFTTFSNNEMIVSASDRGFLGIDKNENTNRGIGFSNKKLGDFLYEGGIIAVAEYEKAVSANLDFSAIDGINSFETIKSLSGENPNLNIIKDSKTENNNRINTEISITYEFPTENSTSIKMKLKAKNISNKSITDFAFGQYYDWDAGLNSINNFAKYFAAAIPAELGTEFAAAEMATDADGKVFIGSLVYLDKEKFSHLAVIPQAAGFDLDYENLSQKELQTAALTSGIAKQTNAETDIAYFVGMYFFDDFKPNAEFECEICTAVESSEELLAKSLLECWQSKSSIVEKKSDEKNISIFNIDNNVNIFLENEEFLNSKIEIFNALGINLTSFEATSYNNIIDFSNFPNGIYFIKISTKSKNNYFDNFLFVK